MPSFSEETRENWRLDRVYAVLPKDYKPESDWDLKKSIEIALNDLEEEHRRLSDAEDQVTSSRNIIGLLEEKLAKLRSFIPPVEKNKTGK